MVINIQAYLYHCVFQKVGAQNITKRLHLKKEAVHNLHWVLTNVYPELLATVPTVNSYAFGGVSTTNCP